MNERQRRRRTKWDALFGEVGIREDSMFCDWKWVVLRWIEMSLDRRQRRTEQVHREVKKRDLLGRCHCERWWEWPREETFVCIFMWSGPGTWTSERKSSHIPMHSISKVPVIFSNHSIPMKDIPSNHSGICIHMLWQSNLPFIQRPLTPYVWMLYTITYIILYICYYRQFQYNIMLHNIVYKIM